MSTLRPVPDGRGPQIFEGDLETTGSEFQALAARMGRDFKHTARDYLLGAGARFTRDHHVVGSYHVEGVICGDNGQPFVVLAHGCFDDAKDSGLRRTDTVKKVGHDAHKIRGLRQLPILLVSSHLPFGGSSAEAQLADCAEDIWDVVAVHGDLAGYQRLRRYLHDSPFPGQLPAPWRDNPSRWSPELFDVDADQQVPVTIIVGAQEGDSESEEEEY